MTKFQPPWLPHRQITRCPVFARSNEAFIYGARIVFFLPNPWFLLHQPKPLRNLVRW